MKNYWFFVVVIGRIEGGRGGLFDCVVNHDDEFDDERNTMFIDNRDMANTKKNYISFSLTLDKKKSS